MSGSAITSRTRHPVQLAATVISVIFVLIGILGFIPGVTTNYERLQFAGHESGALLLGVFAVSVLHNIVHLAFGVVGLAMARTAAGARTYLVGGGVIYAVLWLYGLLIDTTAARTSCP
jgi:hypothetical protein